MKITQFVATSVVAVALAGSILLTGCGTQEIYRDEEFRTDTPFSHRIGAPSKIVCDSVKRTLLNQGYQLEPESEGGVLTGIKNFQVDETMVVLRLRATCMRNPGDTTTTVYATAQQETDELQTLKQPAGVTIGGVVGFTLPGGAARIPITVKRETVRDPSFYARFYKEIEDAVAKAAKP